MEPKIVTREDCDQVLERCIGSDKFEVVNFKVKPFEDKEREYYKPDCILEVSAKVSKNISRFRFFLKKFTIDYPALNDLIQALKTSEREVLFYEQFLPMLQGGLQDFKPDFVAQYIYGEPGRLMIIEDMLLKFFALTKKACHHMLDRFHVSLALKAVAKLHAASWCFEEKLKDEEACRLFEEKDLLSQEPIWSKDSVGAKTVQAGVKGLKSLLKEYMEVVDLDVKLNKQIDDLVQRTFEVMKFQTKYRNVLGHGDLHTKNVLFKYGKANQAEECVLINFGYCRYFLPTYDVLTLIFNSTDRLFRQHYFTYLIKYYYECLHADLMKQELHIDQFMTFEEFQQTINYLMPSIKLKAVLHLEDFGAKPGFYKMIQKHEETYRAFLYADKSPFVLDLYKRDPIFKELVNEALEELLEVLREPKMSKESCYSLLEGLLGTTVYDLKSYALEPVEETEGHFRLVMMVLSGEGKEGEVNTYEYLVKCGDDNYFKVVDIK